MKNNYGKLKRTILIRSLLISVLVAAIGYGILTFLVDGVFQDSFARFVMAIFTRFGIEQWKAVEYYNRIFVYNKSIFVVGSLGILFLFYFYVSVGRLTKYLNDISGALEKTLNPSDEPIILVPELEPMAETLSTLKMKLKDRKSVV